MGHKRLTQRTQNNYTIKQHGKKLAINESDELNCRAGLRDTLSRGILIISAEGYGVTAMQYAKCNM